MVICNIKEDYAIKSLPYFKKLHTLEFIFFYDSNINNLAKCISLCTNLKKLSISNSSNCTHRILLESIGLLKNLEALSFIGMTLDKVTTDSFFNHLSYNLIKLKYLNLRMYDDVTDSDLELFSNLPELE